MLTFEGPRPLGELGRSSVSCFPRLLPAFKTIASAMVLSFEEKEGLHFSFDCWDELFTKLADYYLPTQHVAEGAST
jgi:hypothetical protein